MVKKKSNTPYYIVGFIAIVIVAFFLFSNKETEPGKYDEFAQCIVESNTKLYSAWWCPHCSDQKKAFGTSFDILDEGGVHVECSPGGIRYFSEFCKSQGVFSEFCKSQGVSGTPTWVFPDGTKQSGKLPLEVIAQKTNCSDTIT